MLSGFDWCVAVLHKFWYCRLVWGTNLNMTLIISVLPREYLAFLHKSSEKTNSLKHKAEIIKKNCPKWGSVPLYVVNMFAVGLHSFATSLEMITWSSDFLFYNVPSLFIEPLLLKRLIQLEILVCLFNCYFILHFIVWVVCEVWWIWNISLSNWVISSS